MGRQQDCTQTLEMSYPRRTVEAGFLGAMEQ
jgi:hypothetical protein